uniref:Uncharacterized protein n=1 Tax=Arundo donax TaxID=35708 RepID=A0A0A9DSG9_ARUDO
MYTSCKLVNSTNIRNSVQTARFFQRSDKFKLPHIWLALRSTKIYNNNNNKAFQSQTSWGRLEMKPIRSRKPIHDFGTWIANFHAPLSIASSLVIFQSFRSLFIDSSRVKFGLPRPLLTLSVRFELPQCTSASGGKGCICANHLKRYWTSFFSIGATPTLSRMSSFQTRYFLLWPHILLSIRIFATLNYWTCRLLVGQHSASYSIVGRIAVL